MKSAAAVFACHIPFDSRLFGGRQPHRAGFAGKIPAFYVMVFHGFRIAGIHNLGGCNRPAVLAVAPNARNRARKKNMADARDLIISPSFIQILQIPQRNKKASGPRFSLFHRGGGKAGIPAGFRGKRAPVPPCPPASARFPGPAGGILCR